MSLVTNFLQLFKHDTKNDADLNSNFDIDVALNENWDKIDDAMKKMDNEKIKKELKTGSQNQYKVLSDENYSTTEKNKLKNIFENAQVNVLEKLTMEGKVLNISNKTIEIKDEEVKNARNSKTKKKNFNSLDERIADIEENIDKISNTSGHVYGIKRKITNNTSSKWERILDSVGLEANATKNGNIVRNDFDNLSPWKDIKSCNYDINTGKVKAWIGSPNFKFDGSNGDVYTHIPNIYIKIYQENDYDYILIADYPKSGFEKYNEFYYARYIGKIMEDGKLHSYSGLIPSYNRNISQFRNITKTMGNKFSLLDYRVYILQLLYLVEYADYNSQAMLGNGISGWSEKKSLIAESNVNRIIVDNADAFYVGRTICIGTSGAWNSGVASDRNITKIEDYINGGTKGKAIYFDGTSVNISVGNTIWGIGQKSGQCDELKMKSGCYINDERHSMIYRGIENIFSNMWQFIDGMNIKDWNAYICKDHAQYVSDKFDGPYKALGYINCKENGNPKNLGFDPDEPLFRFPTEIGASTSSSMCDYYWQNPGNRIVLFGGAFTSGANCGLWCWGCSDDSSYAGFHVGCRVLIDQ